MPKMFPVRQHFSDRSLSKEAMRDTLQSQLSRFAGDIKPGASIAIAAGSRGIANAPYLLKIISDFVKGQGGAPFIVPAMGSHGGATAQGQVEVLHSYGITEETIGCPIRATMDVVEVGHTPLGEPVCMDAIAAHADGIVPFCRVKPHTAFTGPIESGIMKMLTIGLGNHHGASRCHNIGYKHFHRLIPQCGQTIIENAPVLFAVAVLEDAFDRTAQVTVVKADQVAAEEPALLRKAKALMPRLLLGEYDILIVDQIGKDISGAGMDPHITGGYATPYAHGTEKPQVIGVLDLTPATNGNAIGLGQADIISRRLYDKMIPADGYANAIVSNMLSTVKVPLIADCDRDLLQIAIKCCEGIDKRKPRIIRIKDTLHITDILVSEALLPQIKDNITVEGPGEDWSFLENGNLW
ncbi:MAG: hypothetical protein K6B40_02325 [Firmicutes bacterium]|nr:hypothetical protein [Bacillota bacterium]